MHTPRARVDRIIDDLHRYEGRRPAPTGRPVSIAATAPTSHFVDRAGTDLGSRSGHGGALVAVVVVLVVADGGGSDEPIGQPATRPVG